MLLVREKRPIDCPPTPSSQSFPASALAPPGLLLAVNSPRSSAACAVSGCARQQGAGIDSTELFDDVGHSDEATGMLKQYYIGELSD